MSQVKTNDHDLFYLEEDRYERPKEIFKIAASRAEQTGFLKPGQRVLDVGCAAGEFLYYLTKHHEGPTYEGYEFLPELVDKASRMVPAASIHQGSVLESSMLSADSVDALFMIGVHSYFDEARPWLANILNWVKPGGYACIFGIFNPHPVDVLLKYRLPERDGGQELRPGWNNWSMKTVSEIIDGIIGPGKHSFIDFTMPFDMPKQPDPIRSWTIPGEEGRVITNGLCIIQHQKFLEIRP